MYIYSSGIEPFIQSIYTCRIHVYQVVIFQSWRSDTPNIFTVQMIYKI